MSADLVGNPEDRFSHNEAYFVGVFLVPCSFMNLLGVVTARYDFFTHCFDPSQPLGGRKWVIPEKEKKHT